MIAVNETGKGWVSAQHLLEVVHGTSLIYYLLFSLSYR